MTNHKQELLKELETEFFNLKKELKLKVTLEELDNVFYVKDQILKEGFVSPAFSRQLCWRISDTFNAWYNYFHRLIIPNPQSMVHLQESQAFTDEEKEKIMHTMAKLVLPSIKNTHAGVSRDKKEEANLINNSLKLWKEVLPTILMVTEKTTKAWEEKAK